MYRVMLSVTVVQGDALVAVTVSITLPNVISARLGRYSGLMTVGSANVPVPDDVHMILVANEVVAVARMTDGVVWHIVVSRPASTMAWRLIFNIIESDTTGQGLCP
jgi:hypothetical protein